MLRILPSIRPNRRHALVAGAFGAWTLADLLRAEAAGGAKSSVKSIINIHLDGGPPQHDTIDPKPDAPEEIRGEFKPIATKIPGFHISELMPKIAGIADKFAFIRSLVGSAGEHDAFQCQSGFRAKELASVGGRPAVGCVLGKLLGSSDDPVPAFVDLMQGRPMVRNSARPGFLGPSLAPFRPDLSAIFARELEPGMQAELAARGKPGTIQLNFADGLTPERLRDRTKLLAGFDDVRRDLDNSGSMDALDKFGRQAVNILTSGKLADALDFDKETVANLARYCPPRITGPKFDTAEDEHCAKKLLLARRLVEAGVRCVSVTFSDFDTHSKNFPRMRQLVPIVDHAIHALVTDLGERGMLGDVAIVVWGEFGRSPKISKEGGREHWPEVGPALVCGGGFRGGQVIGSTDRTGGKVTSRPVSYEDVFASLYKTLGIDATKTTIKDPTGRPQFLMDKGEVISELF